jgi:hypothetical protein
MRLVSSRASSNGNLRSSVPHRVGGSRADGTVVEKFPFFSIVTQRWIVALRASWALLSAIGVAASLCACAPSDRSAAGSRVSPAPTPVIADARDTVRHYGSSAEPRIRHRTVAKRARHRQEVQQADAEWVNPPFGAGE